MRSGQLVFPVLSVNRHGDLTVSADLNSLQTANRLSLSRNYYQDMHIIDSTGASFRVKGVRGPHPVGPWLGFRFLKPRRMRVELDIESEGELSLDAVKAIVFDTMKKSRDFWESGYGDLGAAEATVQGSRSMGTYSLKSDNQ